MDTQHQYAKQEKELTAISVEQISLVCVLARMSDREVVLAPLAIMMLAKGVEKSVQHVIDRLTASDEVRAEWKKLCTALLDASEQHETLRNEIDRMISMAKTAVITGCGSAAIFEQGGMN